MKIITLRCKPFSSSPRASYQLMVEGTSVRVWDSIAGYYTTCHSLSARDIAAACAA